QVFLAGLPAQTRKNICQGPYWSTEYVTLSQSNPPPGSNAGEWISGYLFICHETVSQKTAQ
ncbi:hypothetical protein, partial [Roseovarius sp. 217]|uniref:hypothetical protein n=1 Tax=Roseovarius sp. (strain 217) TaxID=314264 RepID=UPI001C2F1A7F